MGRLSYVYVNKIYSYVIGMFICLCFMCEIAAAEGKVACPFKLIRPIRALYHLETDQLCLF